MSRTCTFAYRTLLVLNLRRRMRSFITLLSLIVLLATSTVGVQVVSQSAASALGGQMTATTDGIITVNITGGGAAYVGLEAPRVVFGLDQPRPGNSFNGGPITAGQNIAVVITAGFLDTFYSPTDAEVTGGPNSWQVLFPGRISMNVTVGATYNPTLPNPAVSGEEVLGGCNTSQRLNCGQWHSSLPVDTSTGNFWHTFDDVTTPGRGIPLSLSRTYNSALAATDSAFGYGWSFTYGTRLAINGNVATLHQENGSQSVFNWNGSAYVPASTRISATLVKNADNTYLLTRNKKEKLRFSTTGQLTSLQDLNGYTTTLTRPNATTLTVTDPSSRALTFAYTGSRITGLSSPGSRTMSYAYDSSGNLTEVTDFAAGKTKFTYDSAHKILTMRSPKFANDTTTSPSPVITNVYDAQNRITSQSDELGRITTFAYSGDWTTLASDRFTLLTDPKGNATQFTYRAGVLITQKQAYGTSVERPIFYEYDPTTAGLTKVKDALGRLAVTTYDANGNATSIVDPLNRTTTATYNALNEPLTTTDPTGRVSTFTYDTAGNLLTTKVVKTESPAQDQVTTFTYGDTTKPGDVTKVTDPAGNFTSFTYNAYGDITSVVDPLGNKATVAYNTPVSLGWKMSEVAPRGNVSGATASQFTTIYEYDAMGRNTAVKDPLWVSTAPTARRSTATYDANGNVLTSTNGDNKTTSFAYNAANELLTTTRPDGSTEKSTFWPDGSLKTQVDGKNNTVASYAYDALGQLSTTTDALNRATSYSYDQVGNVLGKASQGGNCGTTPVGCTRYTYDAGDQLKTVVYSDGVTPNVTYNYDNLGRRTSMVDGTGTSTYSYDSLGRLTSTTNGAGAVMAYGYDRLGNQTSITYPNNQVVTKTYDAAGRNTTITDWNAKTSTFTYDADSNITNAANGNGTAAASTFDRAGQLTAINNNISGWSLANYTGTYDGAGRVTSLGATGYQAEATVSYSYDQVSRLTGAGSSTYGYDNGDNPTTLAGGTTQTFDAASQLLTSNKAGGTTYAYDNRGNRTSATPTTGFATTSTYDQADRTKTVSSQASTPQGYLAAVESDAPNAHYRLSDPPQDNFFATNGNYYGFLSGTAQRNAPGGLKGDGDTSLNFFNNNGEGWLPVTPSNTTAGGDTTVEILMRWQGAGASSPETLFAFESNYHLTIANGNIGFSTKADASDVYGVSAAGLDKKWVHVTAVFRNGSVTASKLYINGVAQTLTQKSGTPVANSASPTASISGTDAGVNHFNGNLDELAIWNKALTATQVSKHAAAVNSYTTSYSYNGDGLRTSTTTGGVTKPLTYDITAQYSQLTFDGENYYIYGPDGLPLEHIGGPYLTTQWYHHDVLGNTRLLTEDDAAKSAEFNYDAYGNITGSAGRADTVLKYRGEQQDRDTGYVYLRARIYDPSTAQFTTVDPLVAQTRSAYGYAINSPLNFTDPSGQIVPVVLAAWAGVEIGLSLWDAYSTGSTLFNECASGGEKLTSVGLFAFGMVAPGGGYSTAGKAGKPFAMGLSEHLDDFAQKHGASTWKTFDDVDNWKPQVLEKLSDPNQRVLFNLDGVNLNGASRAAAGKGGATDWELLQIFQNQFPNLEFFKGGQRVGNPFG